MKKLVALLCLTVLAGVIVLHYKSSRLPDVTLRDLPGFSLPRVLEVKYGKEPDRQFEFSVWPANDQELDWQAVNYYVKEQAGRNIAVYRPASLLRSEMTPSQERYYQNIFIEAMTASQ